MPISSFSGRFSVFWNYYRIVVFWKMVLECLMFGIRRKEEGLFLAVFPHFGIITTQRCFPKQRSCFLPDFWCFDDPPPFLASSPLWTLPSATPVAFATGTASHTITPTPHTSGRSSCLASTWPAVSCPPPLLCVPFLPHLPIPLSPCTKHTLMIILKHSFIKWYYSQAEKLLCWWRYLVTS